MELIDSSHSRLLAKAMDVYALRQRLTASNIANIQTPGFKKLSVSFEEELRKVERNDRSHEPLYQVTPQVVEAEGKPVLEDEMITMVDTQIRVQIVTRALRHHFDMLRAGIAGRSI